MCHASRNNPTPDGERRPKQTLSFFLHGVKYNLKTAATMLLVDWCHCCFFLPEGCEWNAITAAYGWRLCSYAIDCRNVYLTFTRETQQTQTIFITFVQCWNNVEDVWSKLYKCYNTIVLCLPGSSYIQVHTRRLPGVGLMLGQRRRRWDNIKTALGKRLVCWDVDLWSPIEKMCTACWNNTNFNVWASVAYGGPTSKHHWLSTSCLLGGWVGRGINN